MRRLGGSYGGKIGRSALPAGVCALAAYIQRRPVRMVMQLESNMKWLGKRNPMYTKYDVSSSVHYFEFAFGVLRSLSSFTLIGCS